MFVRRRYGYGWRPNSVAGWVITVIAIGGVIASIVVSRVHKSFVGYIVALVILAVFLGIAQATGQRP